MAFEIGLGVSFSIRNTRTATPPRVTLPGIIVGAPVMGVRPNTSIPQVRQAVVSLREAADGTMYLRRSDEPVDFLAYRTGEIVAGLDDMGTVEALLAKAAADFQSYLATVGITRITNSANAAQSAPPTGVVRLGAPAPVLA